MSNNTTVRIPVLSLLGIAFIVLKLCGVITWSWWLVTLPFTIPFAFLLMVLGFAFICILFGAK